MRPAAGTVGDIGERAVIERIRARVSPPADWVALGIGDDAAVLLPQRNRAEVVTVDSLVEGVHFDRAYVPPAAVGHKALAVNLSDLAAMGAEPRAALLSLILPPQLAVAELDAMIGGLLALAAAHGVALVGGNVARSPGPLILDVTATGVVKPRRVLSRAGARPGDDVYVSGAIGLAAAGLLLCQAGGPGRDEGGLADPAQPAGVAEAGEREAGEARDALDAGDGAGEDGYAACRRRFLRPDPRVRLGQLLGRSRAVTACVDSSDGLADAVHQFTASSGVGAVIDAEALPVPRAVREVLGRGSDDWLAAAMSGGEDYELVFTASPRRRRALASALRHAHGLFCHRIGRVTRDRGLVLRRDGADAPFPAGFAHFR